MAQRIKKGDRVVVLAGRDKGREGEVIRSMPRDDKVVVQGINVMTRHVKPTQADPQGGIRRTEAPIHVSNVALKDPKTGKPTKVGFRLMEDGTKKRFARASGEVIDG